MHKRPHSAQKKCVEPPQKIYLYGEKSTENNKLYVVRKQVMSTKEPCNNGLRNM